MEKKDRRMEKKNGRSERNTEGNLTDFSVFRLQAEASEQQLNTG